MILIEKNNFKEISGGTVLVSKKVISTIELSSSHDCFASKSQDFPQGVFSTNDFTSIEGEKYFPYKKKVKIQDVERSLTFDVRITHFSRGFFFWSSNSVTYEVTRYL